jgi:hypothetical protein
MTLIQIIMLVLMPSMAVVALLLCKPAFRPGLARYEGDDQDSISQQPLAEME